MKSSNPKVMIECYRLLVARLAELGPVRQIDTSSRQTGRSPSRNRLDWQ